MLEKQQQQWLKMYFSDILMYLKIIFELNVMRYKFNYCVKMLKYIVYFSALEPEIPLTHRSEHGKHFKQVRDKR